MAGNIVGALYHKL